jgi:DNA repair protein RadC
MKKENQQTLKMGLPEFKISLRYKGRKSEIESVKSPSDAARVCRLCFDESKIDWVEEMIIIALNQSYKVLGFYKISSGGITGTVADPRVIFQFALLSNATSLLIAHNHPSGNLQPSNADDRLTEKIVEGAKCFDITIVDHIILTDESFYSYKDNNKI